MGLFRISWPITVDARLCIVLGAAILIANCAPGNAVEKHEVVQNPQNKQVSPLRRLFQRRSSLISTGVARSPSKFGWTLWRRSSTGWTKARAGS
jgi:hypothetical protein